MSAKLLFFCFLSASVLILGLYFLSDILRPFIIGFLLAYFLDPLTDKIENFKIPRSLGALFLIFIAFLIFIIFFLFILPVFYRQFYQFVQMLPIFYEWILNTLEHNLERVAGNKIQIHENVENFQESIKNNIGFLFDSFLSSTLGVFNFVLDTFITLILTFYLLLDWDRIVTFISSLIPKRQKQTISKIFIDIDLVLSQLFRGQLSVCFILSIYYGLSLFFIGLEGGLIIGIFAGFISFIPLVGAFIGGGLAVLLSIFQFFESPIFIFFIFIVFIIGQIVEGNFLTPKLVGQSAGIHPIWLILSLAFFGKIGGITGLILALPIAAILGVLGRHLLKFYFSSIFFNSKGT